MALLAIPEAGALPVGGDCVVLERVQDPGNVGTILRSAAAAGVGGMPTVAPSRSARKSEFASSQDDLVCCGGQQPCFLVLLTTKSIAGTGTVQVQYLYNLKITVENCTCRIRRIV